MAAEDEFLGLAMPTALRGGRGGEPGGKAAGGSDAVAKAARVAEQRRVTQEQHEAQYRTALVAIKAKIKEVEGPDMKENMAEKIRDWFVAYREQNGALPAFPDAEAGTFIWRHAGLFMCPSFGAGPLCHQGA